MKRLTLALLLCGALFASAPTVKADGGGPEIPPAAQDGGPEIPPAADEESDLTTAALDLLDSILDLF